jgi:hypothetical protein
MTVYPAEFRNDASRNGNVVLAFKKNGPDFGASFLLVALLVV